MFLSWAGAGKGGESGFYGLEGGTCGLPRVGEGAAPSRSAVLSGVQPSQALCPQMA